MRKKLKRKSLKSKNNPVDRNVSLQQILSKLSDVSRLRVTLAKQIYKFKIEKSQDILGKRFFPGTYVLKYYGEGLTLKSIETLQTLSQFKLIPKIYLITPKFMIMKFIKGISMELISSSMPKNNLNIILNNLESSINLWHKLGFFHGDIGWQGNNVIIDMNTLEVYLIDPIIDDYEIKTLSKYQNEYLFQRDLDRLEYLKSQLI